ncbi:hypothetical protein AB1E18_000811 [Capra hircus]
MHPKLRRKPARFLPPGSNMAAPSVCPEVPSRLLAAMTPSAAVGPGTRRVRVIRWRRRNKQEFPWTSCQNRVAWASWKSECVPKPPPLRSGKRQRPVQKRVEHRRMPDVARLCELVKSRRTPRASECARPPQVGPRGSGVGFLIGETAAAVLTPENCFECDGKASMRLTGPAVRVLVPSCCTVRDGSKPERLVRTAVTEGPNLGEAGLWAVRLEAACPGLTGGRLLLLQATVCGRLSPPPQEAHAAGCNESL